MEALVESYEASRRYPEAPQHEERLVRHEPLFEGVYRALMRLHALLGNRAKALEVYAMCVETLTRDVAAEPHPETRALFERLRASPPDVAAPPPESVNDAPLIGRQQEWRGLCGLWRRVCRGEARLGIVLGEAGIGKTRLADELFSWVVQQGATGARSRSYAAEGRLAYAPVTEWLRAPPLKGALAGLEPTYRSEIARLLPELLTEHPELSRPEPLHESWQRQRLFEALARAVSAAPSPLLLVLDDMQWCDRDTLEWLHYLLRFDPGAELLVLGTVRSEEQRDNPALLEFLRGVSAAGRLSSTELAPLDESQTAELMSALVGTELAETQRAQLFAETEGHPVYVVERAQAGLGTPEATSALAVAS